MARSSMGVAALAGLALLAGCGGNQSLTSAASQAPCPRIVILADGADLTRFRAGASGDLTALTADARIAGFQANCDFAGRDRSALDVRVTPRFEVERGPAAEGRTLELPWFVALSDAGDAALLDRQAFTSRVTFGPNVVRTTIQGQTARLSMPLGQGVRAVDYTVRISLQLTPEELALNRARGPR
ncbi:hypothetical protein HB662_04275 [Roseomonas frigidaquae]|uniref:Uncharacterized protein n=1 Tax=Falsiroseomonas frigidaquae TaxID=487318 RepID=A0ABX1ETX9_9PROT|nr:hypothetical protein [Falsiroseomonas frigidaquae]NKE43980.1 hypothetical protein [Falsiroseomonas frigidaquae]